MCGFAFHFPARPPIEVNTVLDKWRAMGYKTCVMRDGAPGPQDRFADEINEEIANQIDADWVYCCTKYPGYAQAVNTMALQILTDNPEVQWIVVAADDVHPDPTKRAEEIAEECSAHFWQRECDRGPGAPRCIQEASTFGVMQPTGDREFGDRMGPYVDRVAKLALDRL